MRSARVPDVASLAWGLPSFNTPEPIRAAVEQAFSTDPDIGKYSLPDGLPEFRHLIAAKHTTLTGLTVDPDKQVVVTAGNMQGLSTLLRVIMNAGDQVIVTDPGFASHIQQIKLCGAEPIYWRLDEGNAWQLNPSALEELISPRTKAIIIVSPSNPSGTIFKCKLLIETAEIARRNNLLVLLDDPYSQYRLAMDEEYFNLASAPDFRNTVVYLFTFSKVHAMSGWRLGYMITPGDLKVDVLKVHDANIICAPRVSQIAGMAALASDSPHITEFSGQLERRRELICERLDRVPHVFSYVFPQGAYYVFPRILVDHRDSFRFAMDLLDTAKVSVTPGSAFGPSGEHHVRMAFCVEESDINLAFDRIEKRFGHES